MDCYTQTYPIARKVHECNFCKKEIAEFEKRYYELRENGGAIYYLNLCSVCKNMVEKYGREENRDEYNYDSVQEWLYSEYCYYCEHCKDCEYIDSGVQECPRIRKHFENLESD